MKEVKVTETLLKEYKNEDLVHYIAMQLKKFNNLSLEDHDWYDYNFGVMMADIERLSELASAVDRRMNKIDKSPNVML